MQVQPTSPQAAPATPYEVRCHRCQCSFAPETRQCIHCGERLGGALLPFGRPGGAPAGTPGPDDEAQPQVPTLARGLLWLLSAGVAVLLSALQTCGVER